METETEKGMTLVETEIESRLVSAKPTGSDKLTKLSAEKCSRHLGCESMPRLVLATAKKEH
jgi:hypothetical protein